MKHVVIGAMLFGLSACANGPELRSFAPSVAHSGTVASVKPAAPVKNKGMFGFLKKKPAPVAVVVPPSSGVADVTPSENLEPAPVFATDDVVTTALAAEELPAVPSMTDPEIAVRGTEVGLVEASKRPRLLGFLRKNVPGDPVVASGLPRPDAEKVERVTAASVSAPSMTDEEIAERGPEPDEFAISDKPRLFGFLNNRTPGDGNGARNNLILASAPANGNLLSNSRRETAPIGPVEFGDFVRACGVKKRDLGVEVARSHGAGTYVLYDTNPGSISQRTQYITGFKDRCPRQFRGALTMFGSAQVHETKRYYKRNTTPYSPTDDAYERAKNRVCRVSKGQPCPAGRYDKLEKDLAFLTIYRGFGTTDKRMEVVLFGGNVAGQTIQ